MSSKRLLLFALLLVILLALPANWLLARRAAPPSWPADVASLHNYAAANLDLAELTALDDDALAARGQHLWEDGANILRIHIPWAMIQPQEDVWDWEALDRVLHAREAWPVVNPDINSFLYKHPSQPFGLIPSIGEHQRLSIFPY